jgi:peptidoglycan/LPS O-acetylase OafA/YrhL
MFVPKYEESFGVHFWFISTIIQFYLVFIPMCKIKEKVKNNLMFAAIFLVASAIWWIFCFVMGVTDIRVWNSFFLQYIWEFAIGMVLADELYHGRVQKIKNLWLLLCLVLGFRLSWQ